MLVKSYENGKVEEYDGKVAFNNRENFVIFKENESYIVRKENVLTICDYRDMMYRVYISNRVDNNIYFAGFSNEEVERISTEGMKKRAYKLPIDEIVNHPGYVDEDHRVRAKLFKDEYVVDLDYTVVDKASGESETFTVQMDHIYDVTLKYTAGKIVNSEYINGVVGQLEDKFKTKINVQSVKEEQRVLVI